jgi:hypothetical protein
MYTFVSMKNTAELLDWIVAMDFAHYVLEDGVYHWYIKRSPERFTSIELIKIYNGDMDYDLRQRWNWALAHRNR